MASVLQKLDSDFNQMRHKILAGVPLEQLKPLSVDCKEKSSGGGYIPSQVVNVEMAKTVSRFMSLTTVVSVIE